MSNIKILNMKKILFLAAVMFSLVACSQQTLPSRQPDQLPSRNPRMLPSRAYQQPKVTIKGNKVIIVMSKQQYLEMERRKQIMIQNKMRTPRSKF
jgi:hypothetical protein